MELKVSIAIAARNFYGGDNPSAEDFLGQLRDLLEIINGLESSISDESTPKIVWRITDAHQNSPVAIELTAAPRDHGVDISRRAELVLNTASSGILSLQKSGERPPYFSDAVTKKCEMLFIRTESEFDFTSIQFSTSTEAVKIQIDRDYARKARRNIEQILNPPSTPYREIGSVEGFIRRVERDGYGRPVLRIRTRIEEQDVKCVVSGAALDRLGHVEVGEIWSGMRVRVFGDIYFKTLGSIDKISVDYVQIFEADSKLPSIDDILDPNFTDGQESVSYLARLREDE